MQHYKSTLVVGVIAVIVSLVSNNKMAFLITLGIVTAYAIAAPIYAKEKKKAEEQE